MALTRLKIDGYGQVELNNVAFRRDGRIEAQCALDKTDFATTPCENGMVLHVNRAKRVVNKPTSAANLPLALVYTTEHMYDERANGLKDFKLELKDEMYPRLGYLDIGDKWTTNTIGYDSDTDAGWTNEDKFVEALGKITETPLYGTSCEEGVVKITATKPESGPVYLVVEKTTMPDGQLAVMLQVLSV